MRKFGHLKWCTVIFLIYALSVKNASSNVVGRQEYQSSMNIGLYNASDSVMILNVTNLKSTIYNSNNAWLVEFYSSWCGHCQRFAPVWKALAKNIRGWQDIVTVAAINCADENNTPTCRDYEVMSYPTIKFFGVDSRPSSMGVTIKVDKTVSGIKHNLINQLQKEQQEGRGQNWPNIIPYKSSEITNLWKSVSNTTSKYILIFEQNGSDLGTEIILDFHKFKDVHIRRVVSDNELLSVTMKVIKFPSVVVLYRNGSQSVINIKTPTREYIVETIKQVAALKNNEIGEYGDHSTRIPNIKVTTLVSTSKESKIAQSNVAREDTLYQIDLEMTLKYSLNHEIPLAKELYGEKLTALKNYLSMLVRYFPIGPKGVMFLNVTSNIISKKNILTGEEFSHIVKSTENEFGTIYSGPLRWIGCKGSSEKYRGYPCGLWTMFHMLTVNFANQHTNNIHEDATLILGTMYGYISNFFGCWDCSQHFIDMATKNKIFDVKNGDENILWLWKAHNEVNARLSGDMTEDPMHKKIQYPSKKHCPLCRYESGEWNEKEVLVYLKKKYSYDSISYYGTNIKLSRDTNDSNNMQMKLHERSAILEEYVTKRKFGWDFTIFDISICVVLYVVSAIILVLVCIKFAVKKTYRKKVLLHKFLMKV